ncbi:hypothetical protein A0H81_02348 [Grifola frondosa]|uniref:Uncharacterized protein n=1 Tax=Grifola frondosa TaxID=5627 RepID=A0A1C7MT22_GRIFR|nr:hypothetical protein A0H81_02348 [Grifola frondosa]
MSSRANQRSCNISRQNLLLARNHFASIPSITLESCDYWPLTSGRRFSHKLKLVIFSQTHARVNDRRPRCNRGCTMSLGLMRGTVCISLGQSSPSRSVGECIFAFLQFV